MSLRSVLIGLLAAVLLLPGLAACDDGKKPASPAASPVAVAPYSTTPVLEKPIVEAGLVERWGEDRVNKMLGEFVEYVRAESWKIERMRPKAEYTGAEFSSVGKPMSPELRLDWMLMVGSALSGDEKDISSVRLMSYYDMDDDGLTFAETGPYVVDEKVAAPALTLDERSHGVGVTLTYSVNLRVMKDGVAHLRPVTKNLTVKMVMVNADGWLIDGWNGNWKLGDARPEKA